MSNERNGSTKEGLELLTFGTPSGYKISIMLEELKGTYGTDYSVQVIDFRERMQKAEWFTKLSPNGRIPVLIDHENNHLTMMEGQAILQYLARTHDPEYVFSFPYEPERSQCEQWIGFAQSHIGPYTAEAVFFNRFTPERNTYAIQHFVGEVERLYGVLDTFLKDREYLVGGKFSIADIANFAVVDVGPAAGVDRTQFPNLHRWWKNIATRPAVQRGSAVPFENPLLGATYMKRLIDEPNFKQEEDALFGEIHRAKEQYGYKFSSP